MNGSKRSLPLLMLLNAVLIAALSVTALSPPEAQAQLGGSGGQYMMVSGEIRGRDAQAVVYVIDLRNSRIVGLLFNSANDELDVIAGADISRNVQRGGGR